MNEKKILFSVPKEDNMNRYSKHITYCICLIIFSIILFALLTFFLMYLIIADKSFIYKFFFISIFLIIFLTPCIGGILGLLFFLSSPLIIYDDYIHFLLYPYKSNYTFTEIKKIFIFRNGLNPYIKVKTNTGRIIKITQNRSETSGFIIEIDNINDVADILKDISQLKNKLIIMDSHNERET